MRLKTQLVLEQARVKTMKITLSVEDPKIELGIRAKMTPEVAETFGCRELVYAGDVARSGVDLMKLDGEEIDPEIRLENDNFAFFAATNKIGDYRVRFEGIGPFLEFKVYLSGYADLLVDVATKVKVDPLTITLKPAQMALGLQEKDTGCVACNNDIPHQPNDPTLHMSGQPCTARNEDKDDDGLVDPKTVPPADDAVPSTAGRRGRKRAGRTEAPEAIAADQKAAGAEMGEPAEEVNFMEDLVGETVN